MALGVALIAAGSLLSAFGSLQGGRAERRAAREQAAALEEAAAGSRAFARFNAGRQRRLDEGTLAQFRADVAKAGVQLEGSPLEAFGESVRTAELNALAIEFEGDLRARGLEAEARLTRRAGQDAFRAGVIGAGTSLLTGFTKVAQS